mgnify:CR=1 FL=1
MGQTRERVLLGVQDFLYTFKELKQERRMAQLKARGLTPKVYVRLMGDAVLWQIKTVAKDATKVRAQACGRHGVPSHVPVVPVGAMRIGSRMHVCVRVFSCRPV